MTIVIACPFCSAPSFSCGTFQTIDGKYKRAAQCYEDEVAQLKAEVERLNQKLEVERAIAKHLRDVDVPEGTRTLLVKCAFACGEISHGRACELLHTDMESMKSIMAADGITQGDGLDAVVKMQAEVERLQRTVIAMDEEMDRLTAENTRLQRDLNTVTKQRDSYRDWLCRLEARLEWWNELSFYRLRDVGYGEIPKLLSGELEDSE